VDQHGIADMKSFLEELKKTGRNIVSIARISILRNTILLLIVTNIFSPDFSEITLFYQQDVRGVSIDTTANIN